MAAVLSHLYMVADFMCSCALITLMCKNVLKVTLCDN